MVILIYILYYKLMVILIYILYDKLILCKYDVAHSNIHTFLLLYTDGNSNIFYIITNVNINILWLL